MDKKRAHSGACIAVSESSGTWTGPVGEVHSSHGHSIQHTAPVSVFTRAVPVRGAHNNPSSLISDFG